MKKAGNKRTRPIMIEVSWGIFVAIIASVILGGVTSLFVLTGRITEENVKYVVLVIQFVAVLLGSIFSGKRAGQKYAIVCGCTSAIYCLTLLAITILFFDSAFHMLWSGVGMCAAGGVAACTMCMIGKEKHRRRK